DPDLDRRCPRGVRRWPDSPRPLHSPRRLHPLGRNGGGLLPVPLPEWLLARSQRWGGCRALLLRLALLLGRGRRAVEPRRETREAAISYGRPKNSSAICRSRAPSLVVYVERRLGRSRSIGNATSNP